ncbi:MAG: CDP-alcohol phosphatidyltransferase family protein [Alphaproteobacteria bacterium]
MSHNTLIHRGVRALVRPLCRTAVTPNQITWLRLATGIGAAICLAVGDPLWRHIGAGVFVLSMVLDRADGELARMSGKTSPGGHKFDLIADAVSNALLLAGLGIGMRYGFYEVWAVPMGIAAGAAVGAILLMVMRLETLAGPRAGELQGTGIFDPDDAILLVPIVVWLGGSEIILTAAAVGAPLFAVYFFWRMRDKLRDG